jgi:hypothetical protein
MELIGLRRNKEVNKTIPFGNKICGFRCNHIHISPQEVLSYIQQLKLSGSNEAVIVGRLCRYLYNLTLCFPPEAYARNEQPQVDS